VRRYDPDLTHQTRWVLKTLILGDQLHRDGSAFGAAARRRQPGADDRRHGWLRPIATTKLRLLHTFVGDAQLP